MKLDDLMQRYRASGRTTRLIEEAERLAKEGRAVYIVAKHSDYLQRIIDQRRSGGGIKCEPRIPVGFDWIQRRVVGSHPNCVWLFDHFFIEQDPVFRSMFECLMQFANEPEKAEAAQT